MNKHIKNSNLKPKYSHLFVLLMCITLFSQVIFAQSSSCPNLTVGPNASLCSGCTSISATLQGTKATTSYSVSSVPYTPFSFNTGTTVLLGIDDTWSSAITIPFCFEFYGNTYTQCIIGSNVLLSFDVANAGNYNTWPINAAVPSATPADLTNCIMGPWHDIDPSVSANSTPIINWKVQGTAPCRAFVVSWTDISMYSSSCNSQLATSQIVLYETTNNIEIFIKDKPLCSGWNSGAAIEGIQNSSGTQAVTVPGRNFPTQWSATNDGQRFTPTGAPQYTFNWYAPGNVSIGTTPTISVCPTTTTTYTATIVNNTCNGPITFSSPVTVTVTPPPCTGVSCSFSGTGDTVCAGGLIALTASTVSNATYQWTGPNGYSSTFQNPTITNATLAHTGWYIVKDTIPGCSYTDSVFVLVIPPPTANAGPNQTICNSTLTLAGSIGGAATIGTWTGGGGTYTPNNTTLNCTYTLSSFEISSGSVTLTLTTDDPPGSCTSANDQMQITFNSASSISAGPDQTICVGNTVALSGSISSGTGSWSGGSGAYSPDNTSATAVYTPSTAEAAAGSVSLSFSADNTGSCPGANDIVVITIEQLPTANAGSTQFICAGLGITLAGAIGGSATSGTWSGGNGTYSPDNTTLNAVYTASPAEFANGTVTLTLTTNDPAGSCSFSTSNVNFKFYENPIVNFTIDTSTGCPILCSNFSDATTIGVDFTIASWNWNFGDGGLGSNIQNPSHCFSTSGYYYITLTATASSGCVSSLTRSNFVEVFNIPVAAFTTNPDPASLQDPAINFNDQSSSDVNYWSWDFGDSTTLAPNISDPVHGYPNQVPGTYLATLIVHNNDGCYDTIAHQIVIGPAFTFFMPTAFSPNANGINDQFFGSGIGITKYDMWIFDRWGDMIFHGKDLTDKWNGKANSGSDDSQIDVYVWKVELTDVFNKKHSFIGTVTLVK
jgi:gliding motility-associated-like protein